MTARRFLACDPRSGTSTHALPVWLTICAASVIIQGCDQSPSSSDRREPPEPLFALSGTNVASGKPVTASMASQGAPLSAATDGITTTNPHVDLGTGLQWIQVDLQGSFDLSGVIVHHYWGDWRTYRDVIIRVSADGTNFTTVFNNDLDGSSGFGVGTDAEYVEPSAGKEVEFSAPICARYVRFYSRGSTVNAFNHYVETQAYGTVASSPCGAAPANVALGKPVAASASSNQAPLSIATDGSRDANPYISLAAPLQWIEVDLQADYAITSVRFWHYWADHRTYHDVIVRASADGASYTTLFSNDQDNSAGFGAGSDAEYAEAWEGKLVSLSTPVCARRLRLYTNGSTVNSFNHLVEVEVVGTPASSPCSPPPPPARDPTVWPFASSSPWNMPMGSGATFESASGGCSAHVSGSGISAWINSNDYSHPVYRASSGDPWVGIYDDGVRVATIQMPTAVQQAGGSDGHLHVIDAARRYVHEMFEAEPRTDGNWNTSYYVRNDLYGSGIGSGGTRAYGGSAIGGLIRAGELSNGIRHALAFALPPSRMQQGWDWPATTEDGFAGTYSGNVPMGTLVAIPSTVNLASIPLSPQGTVLARALQDYGAYLVDSTGENGVPNFVAYVETNAAGELASQTYQDLERLRPYLRCVTNNGPSSVGGGGTPRVPLAPPLGTPPS